MHMAAYDPAARRIVVDIGIDGPDASRVDANLEQMCHFFSTRWCENVSGCAVASEWLQVDGGLINGLPVRGRAFALAGEELSERRSVLAAGCDVLVFVCDCIIDTLPSARARFEGLWGPQVREPPIPVILQANTEERIDCATPQEVEAEVTRGRAHIVVGATVQRGGQGVRATFVTAMEAVMARVPDDVLEAAFRDFATVDPVGGR
jgi:hypothetical protein